MEYQVIEATSLDGLMEAMKAAIAEGFRPQGGVSAAFGEKGMVYAQAVVRGE